MEQVQKQPRRLSPGQGSSSGSVHALEKTDLLRHGHVALGPDTADIGVLIAQQPQQYGHGLPGSDRLLRVEGTVRVTGDQALSLSCHVHIGGSPVGPLHIREHGDGAVEPQLALAVHSVDRHLAELGAGQVPFRAEGTIGIAVQRPHEAQRLNGQGGILVRHVGKAARIRRKGRHRQGRRRHHQGQQ